MCECVTCAVKILHHDGGREFANHTMEIVRDELGIWRFYIPPACHNTNGVVERRDRSIVGKLRTLLADTKLQKYLWEEAAMHATQL